jgi:hypothetical protein
MESIAALNSIADTKRHIGLGHTKVYELIGQGILDARKAGKKTLITGESIRAYIASLPPAEICPHARITSDPAEAA